MVATFDITMTAALRPNVLVRTLSSMKNHLRYDGDFRLVVDIAPVPLQGKDKDYVVRKQREIADIVSFYFPRNTVRCIFDSPQAEALKWTWEHTRSPFILQWEDDWELLHPIHLDEVLDKFNVTCDCPIGMIYLDRNGKSVKNYPGYEGVFKRMDESLYIRTKGKSLGGPPAVLSRTYLQSVLKILDGITCLDLLSATPKARALLKEWGVGVFAETSGGIVRDIGKAWKNEMGLIMRKNTERGVQWLPKK